jgi:transcriptional regulator with XRE-family HTH domain
MQMHRLNRRLSISALADKVDLSAHALSRIERGEETPTADILERIRRTLQVPP